MESPSKKLRFSSPPSLSSSSCAHAPLKAWLASMSKSSKPSDLGLDRVEVRADAHGGMGLFAAQPLEPGAVVFTVPRAAVVSPEVVNADSAVGCDGTFAAFPYPFRAAHWLVLARRDPHHPFNPFVRTLPAAPPNAPWWSARSRSWLQGSNLGFACESARNLLATQWAEAGQAADAAAVQAFLAGVTLEDMRWGMGCYDSRRLPLRLSGVSQGKASTDDSGAATGEGVMVPLLDFGNHHADAKVNWEADADGVQFRLTNSTTLPAGAELFNHYGEKGNEETDSNALVSHSTCLVNFFTCLPELLMAYGFAIPNNPHDGHSLVLSIGTAPPPAPQTKLGPFMLRLPPTPSENAGDEEVASEGSNSSSGNSSSSSTSQNKDILPQFPPALWRALSDPMKYAAEVTDNTGDTQQVYSSESSVEVDDDDVYFLLETLRPRLAKARSLLEQHQQRSISPSNEDAQLATFVGYYFSGQVRVLEEAVASLESILGDEAYEEDDDEGDGENGAKV